jgi:hypothetical protein
MPQDFQDQFFRGHPTIWVSLLQLVLLLLLLLVFCCSCDCCSYDENALVSRAFFRQLCVSPFSYGQTKVSKVRAKVVLGSITPKFFLHAHFLQEPGWASGP